MLATLSKKSKNVISLLLALVLLALPLTMNAFADTYDLETDNFAELKTFLESAGGGSYSILIKSDINFEGDTISLNGKTLSLSFASASGAALIQSGGARHFTINGAFVTMSFDSGLTLSGSSVGGGIEMNGNSTLTFSGKLVNCTAEKGGAIYTDGGALTISGSSFSGNSAKVGGALYVTGSCALNVSSTVFSGNSATSETEGSEHADEPFGGGAAALGENVTASFSACSFSGNSAVERGGAIDLLRVYHFYNKDCQNCLAYYNKLTLSGCSFSGNSLRDGRASYLDSADNPELYEIYMSKVSSNGSVSAYSMAYNNLDVCYVSDFKAPEPPPIVRPEYSLTLEDGLSFPVSDTYPEKIDRSISWEELSQKLKPTVYDSSGKSVPASVKLSCEGYETAVNYWKPGEYEINVSADFSLSGFSYTKKLTVKLEVVDETPPELEIEKKIVTLLEGHTYASLDEILELAGYTARDNTAETPEVYARILAYDFSEINWYEPSEYGVYVYARDSSGNEAQRANFILVVS